MSNSIVCGNERFTSVTTVVGILIFMNMINTTSEHLKARKVFYFKHFRFYENWECMLS